MKCCDSIKTIPQAKSHIYTVTHSIWCQATASRGGTNTPLAIKTKYLHGLPKTKLKYYQAVYMKQLARSPATQPVHLAKIVRQFIIMIPTTHDTHTSAQISAFSWPCRIWCYIQWRRRTSRRKTPPRRVQLPARRLVVMTGARTMTWYICSA